MTYTHHTQTSLFQLIVEGGPGIQARLSSNYSNTQTSLFQLIVEGGPGIQARLSSNYSNTQARLSSNYSNTQTSLLQLIVEGGEVCGYTILTLPLFQRNLWESPSLFPGEGLGSRLG